ncbi:Glycosyltransferase involved in cell wall bisynthesis [Evansella caseinilytica]|uniref:Glycosyltransferase involved in cell wall bisynthesis n=1 Tax=Evansella caseinilytica TaxID=1503961 RepID=A0A1H3ULV2_9BACI|nr:glycosyltransferase family 4 protein [Evansella caseinilytica]SDZ63327.1 Glycosyltransferase involved in cell wall bisynthesis [Evansella caseinilytica]
MKILFVTTISNTVNAFLIPHMKLLIDQGNQVDVAFNLVAEVHPDIKKLGCNIHQVAFQRHPARVANFRAYRKIRNIILKEQYQIVHVHTPVAAFLTRLACRNIPDVRILYTAHGFHFYQGAPFINWAVYHTLEKIAANWTDGLITMNEEDYAHAGKLPLRKKQAVYNVNGVGLDLEKFIPQTIDRKKSLRAAYGYNDEDFILICVAELSARKNQEMLIRVVSRLKEIIPDIKLLLAGEGSCFQRYKSLVHRLGVEKHVEFLGYRNDVDKLMTLSDIAVSAALHEGLPVNVMEAMATGLPLVVTDTRGNRDLVRHGVNGYVTPVTDDEQFAAAVEKLYRSEERRSKLGEESIQAIQNYSLQEVMTQMSEVYFQAGSQRLTNDLGEAVGRL